MSEIFVLAKNRLGPQEVDRIVEALKREAIIIYPTETFYGLGGLANFKTVVDRIFQLKGRESAKTLPFIASDLEMVLRYVEEPGPLFYQLTEIFWPGPLTLVLKARKGALSAESCGPEMTIALRVPPLEWLRELVRKSGQLLISTSANLSGFPPLNSFKEVHKIFADQVDIIIDGGDTPGEKPSTIIDLTGPLPVCLREGKIPEAKIWEALNLK